VQRYICIHGHFYQPPRENPWLETVEVQDSAYPHHDWNERITAECYGTNAASRILEPDGRIARIVNNYARISFNFGPTLLSWMAHAHPDVYARILAADRESRKIFGGHGSALAQAYNHMIMPLANDRDRYTQALWGVRDFRHRFGRDPEGMWLPETAVDIPTLETLADLGIAFTILEPGQASRVKKIGGKSEWLDVSGGRIDPTRPYEQRLPSGRRMAIFFYDGPVSRAVAFEKLLDSGERFAGRLAGLFDEGRKWPQVVHIATDGETYGHHHRHGDMALAYALRHIEETGIVRLINYGLYLEKHPPTHQVEIVERTAWSCAHGVGRWERDCSCNSGMKPGWNQAWRAPLRAALDWLRDELAPRWEKGAKAYFDDPWAARDDFISVVLDRSAENVSRFLTRHAGRPLNADETEKALGLLELQRHAMLMYTSCGWFFDDLSGIETVQVMAYAGRAVQLAEKHLGADLEAPFLERLSEAKSNLSHLGDGRQIYERYVRPARVDLLKVGAHYAVSSLFEDYGETAQIYCYRTDRHHVQRTTTGRATFLSGRMTVTSEITRASEHLSFGAIHFGDHNVAAGVRAYRSEDEYDAMVREVTEAFGRADFAGAVRRLDHHFGQRVYSLESLFRDEQRKVLDIILENTLEEAEGVYRSVYERNVALMRFLIGLGTPLPRALRTAAAFVLNLELRRAFDAERFDVAAIRTLMQETRSWELELDAAGLEFALEASLERLATSLRENPDDEEILDRFHQEVDLAYEVPFEVDLYRTQNLYWAMLEETWPRFLARAESGDPVAKRWTERFRSIGERLSMKVT
jgi:alpha-amylase/alpha-mannosidase (GH57 family)